MTFLPLAIGWLAALGLLLLDGRRRAVGWISVAALAGMLASAVALLVAVAAGSTPEVVVGGWPAGLGIRLRADWLTVGYAVPVLAIILVLELLEVLRGGFRARIGPALVVLLALGLTGLFLTADVFNFYVFFEISMAAAFGLSALGSPGRRVSVASLFVVMNLLGSVIFLIAVGALYHLTGSLDMRVVAERLAGTETHVPLVVASLLLTAFLIKLGIFPFHFWVPGLYGQARAPAAALFAGALANVGSYGLLRFGGSILPQSLQQGRVVLLVIGAATIVFGSLVAVARQPVAEVLAYSSIAQNGYILVALGVGGSAGLTAAYVYAIVNSMAKALLFASTGVRGAGVGGAFLVGAMSTTGLPPALGFVGKLALFRAAWAGEQRWLVAWVTLGALLAFVYMLRAFDQRFWRVEEEAVTVWPVRATLGALAAVSLALGLWPEPLIGTGARVAAVLTGASP